MNYYKNTIITSESGKSSSNPMHIPTREEFHRQFSGLIYESDFHTSRCIEGSHIERTARALRFDETQKGGNQPCPKPCIP